jgi:hypothetical protein
VTEPAVTTHPGSKGDPEMAGENIRWRHSLEDATREAQGSEKLILIDLFNPG